MAVKLGPLGSARPQFFDDQGNVLNGGKLHTYLAGTTTNQSTYTDSTGGVANSNPITLDADGRAPNGIWLSDGAAYKFVLKDSAGNTLWTEDQVLGINDVSAVQDQWIASGLTATYVSASSFTVPGDETTELHVGRRLKIVDGGGTKYGTIHTSAFTTLTTIVVSLDAGASLTNPVSSVSYGMLSATNPSLPAGYITASQIGAAQNDYAPTGYASASTLRISSDARRNITGLAGGTSGREVTIHNVGTFPIPFKFEDSGSVAANRFAFGHTLSGGHSMTLKYDSTSARWRCTFREIPAGMILPFGGGTVPEGFLARDGSNVSRTTYAALFNEVSTTWGAGDGSTTFGVGDDRRRTWVGSGGSGTATLAATVGSTGGAETHTLTTPEIPAHTHTSHTHVENSKGNDSTAQGGDLTAGGETSGSTGGGGAHNIMQPAAVITSIIKY